MSEEKESIIANNKQVFCRWFILTQPCLVVKTYLNPDKECDLSSNLSTLHTLLQTPSSLFDVNVTYRIT
jgi:hypothetical protein